ncbi:hypothetical protein CCUS01_04056 [Colletotrichum cuscutae]|uniref:Uncharacterized protein n=1 Tax=Colletotrichum cuscutae TaxID=1209917 RepID=A0AAI9VG29_9PEZI|nr:hypothetical protein CCUS01_04056 [Colletotrichum cuscutae]
MELNKTRRASKSTQHQKKGIFLVIRTGGGGGGDDDGRSNRAASPREAGVWGGGIPLSHHRIRFESVQRERETSRDETRLYSDVPFDASHVTRVYTHLSRTILKMTRSGLGGAALSGMSGAWQCQTLCRSGMSSIFENPKRYRPSKLLTTETERNTKRHVGCHSVAFLSVCFLLGNLMMDRSFHFPPLKSLTPGRACPGPATQPMGPNVSEQCCVWVGPTHGCVDQEWESISATAVRTPPEKRRQDHLTGAIVVDFDVHAVSQTLLEMLFRPGWGMNSSKMRGTGDGRQVSGSSSVRGRHIRQCMLLLVAFPALLASLALEADCLLVGTAGWLAYAASSPYELLRRIGSTYHPSTTIDRDRSEERLARHSPAVATASKVPDGWERQKGAKSTGAPLSGNTWFCFPEISESPARRAREIQERALHARAQESLRYNLPIRQQPRHACGYQYANWRTCVLPITFTLQDEAGLLACLIRVISSLGSSIVVVGPANLTSGIKLQNDPRMPNALARTEKLVLILIASSTTGKLENGSSVQSVGSYVRPYEMTLAEPTQRNATLEFVRVFVPGTTCLFPLCFPGFYIPPPLTNLGHQRAATLRDAAAAAAALATRVTRLPGDDFKAVVGSSWEDRNLSLHCLLTVTLFDAYKQKIASDPPSPAFRRAIVGLRVGGGNRCSFGERPSPGGRLFKQRPNVVGADGLVFAAALLSMPKDMAWIAIRAVEANVGFSPRLWSSVTGPLSPFSSPSALRNGLAFTCHSKLPSESHVSPRYNFSSPRLLSC